KLASSTLPEPSRTTPSNGIRSPGLTSTISPTNTSLVNTSTNCSPLMTLALAGCRLINFRTASDAFFRVSNLKYAKNRCNDINQAATGKKFGSSGLKSEKTPIIKVPQAPADNNTFALITLCLIAMIVFLKIGYPTQSSTKAATTKLNKVRYC